MGDEADDGFTAFMAGRSRALLRTAYLLTGDDRLAEDLLQTALAKAYLNWGRISTLDHPEAYVRRIIATTNIAWWRRRRVGEVAMDDLPDRGTPDGADDRAVRDQVWRAIQSLPRRQRATLVLRFFEDMSEAEAAETLGVSVGTVKSQTSKALATLRRDPQIHELVGPAVRLTDVREVQT